MLTRKYYTDSIIVLVFIIFISTVLTASELSPSDLKTDNDRISYSLGVQIMNTILKGKNLNMNLVFKGITDAMTGKQLKVSPKPVNLWKTALTKPPVMKFDKKKDYFWILKTNKGNIRIKLMPQVAPMHVSSTIFLTRLGFYDMLTFHRVIKGFMAQAGCPLGSGSGSPGYSYAGEFDKNVRHDKPYRISMANAGPGTDGSQFFITFAPAPHLDGKHTIFGDVVKGKDVLKKIEAAANPDPNANGVPPTEKLVIIKALIEEKPKKG